MSATVSVSSYGQFWVLRRSDQSLWELGRNRLGVTFKAVDPTTGTNVAVKVLTAEFLEDDTRREQFLTEVQKLSCLVHPNIAMVVDFGWEEAESLYVTELVGGETLEERVRRDGPMRPVAALELLRPVVAALADGEKRQLFHSALDPSRIVVRGGEVSAVKVLEFGLAKSLWSSNEANHWEHLLDIAYGSPEQLRNEAVDNRTDIYSVGAILWFLCTARPLFSGSDEDVVYQHQHAALPEAALALCPQPLAELFERMLAKSVEERFERITDVVPAFDRVLQELKPTPARASTPQKKRAGKILRTEKPAKQPKQSTSIAGAPLKQQAAAQNRLAEMLPLAVPVALPEKESRVEPAEEPQPPRRRRSRGKLLIGLAVLLTLCGLAGFLAPSAAPWLQHYLATHFPANGSFSISTQPPGAVVRWQGNELGRTPLAQCSLSSGTHVLEVSAPGYQQRAVEVTIKGGLYVDLGQIVLEKELGTINLETDPAGLSYQVLGPTGESISGYTPANLRDLTQGDYRVTVHRVGWPDYHRAIALTSSDPVLVSQQFRGGTVKITAEEPATTVTLDGASLGALPIEMELSAGIHTLVAKSSDNEPQSREIFVETGKASTVNFVAPAAPINQVTIWSPGDGVAAATPSPTPLATPEETRPLLPTPTPRKSRAQRAAAAVKPRPVRARPALTPTPTVEERRQLLAAKQAQEQAAFKNAKAVIDQQIANTTGAIREQWKYRLAKWRSNKAATDAQEAADRKALEGQ